MQGNTIYPSESYDYEMEKEPYVGYMSAQILREQIIKIDKNSVNGIGCPMLAALETEICVPYLSSRSKITPFVQPNPF